MTQDLSPQAKRDQMYGELDLGSFSLFSGSFINYGYWPDLPDDRPITLAERTESQAELYRQVASRLKPEPDHRLIELGCGLGVGAALVAREFGATVTAMDRSEAQLERARKTIGQALADLGARLSLHRGSVTEIPWPDGTFDGVYSVEMLQHVDDLPQVASEVHRILHPGGRFAAATFFAPGPEPDPTLPDLLETVADGIDVIHPIGAFAHDLAEADLIDIDVITIGDRVWRQFDRWIAQTEWSDSWGRNLLRCYESATLDYYLITARRPTGHPD